MMFRFSSLLITGLLLASTAAYAQYQPQYQDDSASSDAGSDSANIARLQVKISQLEEQMRALQGNIEKVSFENTQLKAQLDKSNADTQFRLTALENKQAAATAAAIPPAPDTSQMKPVEPVIPESPDTNSIDVAPDANSVPAKQQGVEDAPKFKTSRELYTYAYGMLSHAKYAQAGDGFTAFTQRYPKDPLVGNAYYWLGETYYVRHDYLRAADNFRQGYEAAPTGVKASDNLLKLSMTLNALNKDKEACGVLRQVIVKFGASSAPTKAKAEQEINRIGCTS